MEKAKQKKLLENLPASPGVYLMKNADGKILYVGKAKNLRHRVRSYFARGGQDTRFLARNVRRLIDDIEIILTASEKEALLLENNLIKAHTPRFNVKLRDDKERYDVVVLDPPAFAKKKHQVEGARRGYREINLQALQLLNSGGELFTFSCSQHLDEFSFRKTVFEATSQVGVRLQLLQRLGHPWDHPSSFSHLEGEYLKGLHLRRV